MINRRLSLATLAAALCAPFAVLADSFPAKPVSIMVPYPAGGLSDTIARQVNTPLSTLLKQPVLVENVGGASGAIAGAKVLGAPADGYYLFQGSPNELILAPLTNAAIKFKSEDFRLVQMVGATPLVFLVRKDLPVSNVDEFVEYARAQAKAGKPVSYASVGPGSLYHLLGAYMAKTLGIEMLHVPYRGGAPAVQDLLGGQVDMYLAPYGKHYNEFDKQGKLKILALLNKDRQESTKQYPAIGESKALKNFVFNTWSGYFVKKGTPEPVVQKLHADLTKVMADPAVVSSLEANSLVISKPESLADLAKTYTAATQQYRDIAKQLNLKAE
ncbi:MAG: tripartite tricarboxylate transporter substrate binding protein [Proteobacteria bacterium]|nr:tripartite tricarboxylate transporter substrate binding protein [Pseudomonadota bacterium]